MTNAASKHIASKLLGSEWSFGYNCYEVGHTWTPSCTDAALEVSLAAAGRVAPLYALLYGFSQVAIQKRFDLDASWESTKSIIRSTSFIFFHFYNGSIIGCALRHTFGRFYYRVLVCIPALVSSYLSLLIEKPARRQALAFYLLNLASEIVYRMIVSKGYFKPIRHGETMIFALSLAAWYHLIKTHGFGRDPVSAVFKLLIGRDEAPKSSRTKYKTCDKLEHTSPKLGHHHHQQQQQSILNKGKLLVIKYIDLFGRWIDPRCNGKHASCPHKSNQTCLSYILEPIPSRFLAGYLIQIALKLSSRPYELIQRPLNTIGSTLTSSSSVRFGLFIAQLVSSGRLTSCLLRRYSDVQDPEQQQPQWHAACSGFIAGLSMLWAPRSSISMYVMWKAIEQYYLLIAKQNNVRYFHCTIMTIYSISAATLLYTFVLEPRLMRPSYMKFLDNVSDHRLHQLNRMVLDVFGTGSSVGYEDYFPDLHPKYMSNQFKELVFNWMIQPYE